MGINKRGDTWFQRWVVAWLVSAFRWVMRPSLPLVPHMAHCCPCGCRLALVCAGFWSPTTVGQFQILGKAAAFDNDTTDDDNQQQTTIALVAKSRSLMWLPIPGGVLLNKLAEATNDPVAFIADEHSIKGLVRSLFSPRCRRRVSACGGLRL